jgi:hypothetical protein
MIRPLSGPIKEPKKIPPVTLNLATGNYRFMNQDNSHPRPISGACRRIRVRAEKYKNTPVGSEIQKVFQDIGGSKASKEAMTYFKRHFVKVYKPRPIGQREWTKGVKNLIKAIAEVPSLTPKAWRVGRYLYLPEAYKHAKKSDSLFSYLVYLYDWALTSVHNERRRANLPTYRKVD